MENVEINNIVKIMGLQNGQKYKTVKDMKSLRYGRLLLMADQDQDGSHFPPSATLRSYTIQRPVH